MFGSEKVFWDVIVVTCLESALSNLQNELNCILKTLPAWNSVPVLYVEDPALNIGSGAATLNALLVATEHLCVENNYEDLSGDVLTESRVLILHMGKPTCFYSCGTAFLPTPFHPTENDELCGLDFNPNIKLLLGIIEQLECHSPPGVWICSCDTTFWKLDDVFTSLHKLWVNEPDCVLFVIPTEVRHAVNHGAVRIHESGSVREIIYQGEFPELYELMNEKGRIPVVSGVVYLSSKVAESFLSLHVRFPLESCTYMGADSGVDSIQVSLYFDILIAMTDYVSDEVFLSGMYSTVYNLKAGFSRHRLRNIKRAKALIWKQLSQYHMIAAPIPCYQHIYWADQYPVGKFIENFKSMNMSRPSHSNVEVLNTQVQEVDYMLMNTSIIAHERCVISSDALLVDVYIKATLLDIGERCYISGLYLDKVEDAFIVPPGYAILQFWIKYKPQGSENTEVKPIIVILGVDDYLNLPISEPQSTFCNQPWNSAFHKLNIVEGQIWDRKLLPDEHTLLNAKLFTVQSGSDFVLRVMSNQLEIVNTDFQTDYEAWKNAERLSISDIMSNLDYSTQFDMRRKISSLISCAKVEQLICGNLKESALPYIRLSCFQNLGIELMDSMDMVLRSADDVCKRTRTLFIIAEILAVMAGKKGGLRTGPGNNKMWSQAFMYLHNNEILKGIEELSLQRKKWQDTPVHLMRAARHYERAAHILIKNSVFMSKQDIIFNHVGSLASSTWLTLKCPVRIDLAGGWSDTPPMCYECGGSVVNMAVTVDGVEPIEIRAQTNNQMNIKLVFGNTLEPTQLIIRNVNDLLDFDKPNAPGALFKACIIYAEVVKTDDVTPLEKQLSNHGLGGFELHAYSNLPHGCGLGTSSILAGGVLMMLWTLLRCEFNPSSVIHGVLCVEQLLTTGGGWQDQVGGLIGGIKLCKTGLGLPISIEYEKLTISDEFLKVLNAHFLLIYTGKVRLAKSILQNVIRKYYYHDAATVKIFEDLMDNSSLMQEALSDENLQAIGQCMNVYRSQKEAVASNTETQSIKLLMAALKPFVHGQCLTGAGGGGFLCILTKEPHQLTLVKELVSGVRISEATVHEVAIHTAGCSFDSFSYGNSLTPFSHSRKPS